MNERIKELAEEAGLPTADYYVQAVIGPRDIQKFAELIVKDCATIDFYKRTGISLKDDYRVTQVILEHFGVKE